MTNYYLGTIKEVLDPDLYKILIDVPGLSTSVEAFPMRGELDEPRAGDQVLVRDIDPIFHSFYLYSKIKDDKFIGFRSRGKMVQITEEEINICIFNPEEKYEENEDEIPKDIKAFLKIKKDGNIEISNIGSDSGDAVADINSNLTVTVKGNATFEVSGETEINSPSITLTGNILKTGTGAGSVSPTGAGPFCAIPICPLTGAPHVGPRVMGV